MDTTYRHSRRHAVIAIEARECIHSDAMGSAFGV
ncbi:UNVERIFIED_ORG: hypothetical protein M2215_002154 [Bradyrhizobium japonicum]|jgi:hypothetical protein